MNCNTTHYRANSSSVPGDPTSDRIASTTAAAPAGTLTSAGDSILTITSYENVQEAEIRGVEGSLRYDLGRVLGSLNGLEIFTTGTRLLRAEDLPGSAAPRPILNVADLTLISGVEYEGELASARFAGRYVGERVDSDYVAWWAPGRITYPAYLVLDLTGSLRIAGRYTIGAEIRNLANEDYFEVRGYNLPGRSVRISLGAGF